MRLNSGMFRAYGVLILAVVLGACGGGTDPASAVETVPVTVQVTRSSGEPFSGVSVRLIGSGVDRRGGATDAAGQIRFDGVPKGRGIDVCGSAAGVPGGERCQRIDWPRVLAAEPSTLVLYRYADVTPVVLGLRSTPGSEGRTLSVEVDFATLGENGAAIMVLTDEDVGVNLGYRDWDWEWPCVLDATGAGIYPCPVERSRSFSSVPEQNRSATATAVLLDQSERMAAFDPTGIRLGAVNTYLDSIVAPDTVALASYRGAAGSHELTTYSGFTSEGAGLRSAVGALAGQEGGPYALGGALADMLAFTAANAPAGATSPRRSVVVLAPRVADGSACDPWWLPECKQTDLALVAEASRQGIAVVAIGPWPSDASAIALLTGGAFVAATDPTQLPAVFRGLGAIVGRSLPFNRLRVEFDGQPGVFLPGHVLLASLTIRLPQGIFIELPLHIRI